MLSGFVSGTTGLPGLVSGLPDSTSQLQTLINQTGLTGQGLATHTSQEVEARSDQPGVVARPTGAAVTTGSVSVPPGFGPKLTSVPTVTSPPVHTSTQNRDTTGQTSLNTVTTMSVTTQPILSVSTSCESTHKLPAPLYSRQRESLNRHKRNDSQSSSSSSDVFTPSVPKQGLKNGKERRGLGARSCSTSAAPDHMMGINQSGAGMRPASDSWASENMDSKQGGRMGGPRVKLVVR